MCIEFSLKDKIKTLNDLNLLLGLDHQHSDNHCYWNSLIIASDSSHFFVVELFATFQQFNKKLYPKVKTTCHLVYKRNTPNVWMFNCGKWLTNFTIAWALQNLETIKNARKRAFNCLHSFNDLLCTSNVIQSALTKVTFHCKILNQVSRSNSYRLDLVDAKIFDFETAFGIHLANQQLRNRWVKWCLDSSLYI